MNNIQLYIQDSNSEYVEVDLFDNENISVVDSIQDTRDIKKLYNLFTRDFNVPASFNNNKRFKHYYNSNITNGFDARLKTKALIKVGGADFKLGLLKLIDTKLKNDKIDSYKLSFQGETISLSDKLQKDEIKDLNFDELSFTNSEEYLVAGIKRGLYVNSLDTIGTPAQDAYGFDLYPDVIYVPIFSTGKVVPVPFEASLDFSAGDAIPNSNYDIALVKYTGLGVGSIADKESTGFVNTPITAFDFQPAVKVGRLLKMIGEQYDLPFQDSFLHREELDQLYMSFNNTEETSSELGDSVDAFNINSSSANSIEKESRRAIYTTETTPSSIGATSFVLTNTVTKVAVDDDIVIVRNTGGHMTIVSNTSTEDVSFILRKFYITSGGDRVILSEKIVTESNAGFVGKVAELNGGAVLGTNGELIEFEVEVMASGDIGSDVTISFEYVQVYATTTTFGYSSNKWDYNNIIISAQAYLQIKKFSPKIKLIDMLTGIFKMFNMTAYIEDGELIIQKLAEYYKEGKEYNITRYIDTKSASVAPGDIYRNISMKYEDAEDVMTKSYSNSSGTDSDINFGGYKVNKNDFVYGLNSESKDGKDYEIKLPFQRMMFERLALGFDSAQSVTPSYSETTGGLLTDIVIGNQIDEKLEPVKTKPILFYGNKVDLSTGLFGDRDLVITTSTTTASSNNNGLSTLTKSLNNDDYLNTWWNPSGRMASNRRRRDDFFINYNEKTLGLSFDNNIDEFTYNYSSGGLYESNYEEYIESIYLRSARILKYNITLPQSIINNYKLNDTVIVGTNLYNINKINVNLLNGKGSIELINKLNLSITNNAILRPGDLAVSNSTSTSHTITLSTPSIHLQGLDVKYQLYNFGGSGVGELQSGFVWNITGQTSGQLKQYTVRAFDEIGNISDESNLLDFSIP